MRRPNYKIIVMLMMVMVLIVGCASENHPMGKPLPRISYDHLNPYRIEGGSVILRQAFKPDAQTLKIAQEFPVAPHDLIRRYAAHRFVSEGAPVKMVFNVQNAALLKRVYKSNAINNVAGFFTGTAQDLYELHILVSLSPVRDNGSLEKPFTVAVNKEIYLSQNLSLSQKEFRLFEFLEQAIGDLDRAVVNIVTEKLRPRH